MAKARTQEKTTTPAGTTRLNVNMPEKLKRQLNVYAARHGREIKEVVIDAIRAALKSGGQKPGETE